METINEIEVVADKPYKLIYPIKRMRVIINGKPQNVILVKDKRTEAIYYIDSSSPSWALVDVFPSDEDYSDAVTEQNEDLKHARLSEIKETIEIPIPTELPYPYNLLHPDVAVIEMEKQRGPRIKETPERVSPLQYTPIPNPHIDKQLLTKQELLDVLAWAIETATGENFPQEALEHLASLRVAGIPDSAAEKLAAVIATLTYGENNYIGPGKTGNKTDTLLNVVTTVPALSEADARARAHDIGVFVDPSPATDSILPPLAQATQALRPMFVRPSDRLASLRSRYSSTNSDQLAKTGTIEQNPGPIYEIGAKDTIDVLTKITSNPVDATSYLNDQGVNWRVDEMAYITGNGTFALRGGLDNQTDYILLEDFYSQYCSDAFGNIAASTAISNGRFYRYAINNKFIKEQLADAPLGTGIKAALNDIKTFTDMQRTQTNTVNGDALIALYERAPKTDYGCYLPIAKALAYEMTRGSLSGQANIRFKYDYMYRNDPGSPYPVPTMLYPGSDCHNAAAPPAGVGISAYWMAPQTLARAMTGQIPMPAGFNLDSRDIAYVVCSPTLTPDAQSYYTILHLEYPFLGGLDGNAQCVWTSIGGAVPGITAATLRPRAVFGNLIDGPKYRVIFACTTAPTGAFLLGDGLGNTQAIQEYTGVGPAPPPSNILPSLYTYWANGWNANNGVFSVNYAEVLQYLFLTADLNDWKAAFTLASAVMGDYDFPNFGLNTTAAASVTVLADAANGQPVIDGTIPVRNTGALGGGTQVTLTTIWDEYPCLNCVGMPSVDVPQTAVPGAGLSSPRDVTMVQCLVQDSPWMTKFAIISGMFKKSVLSGQALETLTKIRLKNVYYAHRHFSQVKIQGIHNFWQGRGITRRMAFIPGNAVIDRRTQLWTKLYSNQCNEFKEFAGWVFMRPQMPKIYTETAVPGALNGFASNIAYWDSPMYYFNHLKYVAEAKNFYPKPETSVILQSVGKVDFEPGATTATAIFGVNTGGPGSIRMRWENNTDGSTDQEKRWKSEARAMFALAKCVSLLNPGNIVTMVNTWVVDKHGLVPLNYRSPMNTSNTPFLRFTSASAPSDNFRNSARGWMVITMPFFPPEYNLATGQQLLLGMDTQAVPTNLRLAYNLLGMGSANFGLIQTSAGGDSTLDVSESPF
jgi:hypothetical protein